MESIKDYRIIEKIHERRGAAYYQAENLINRKPVFIELVDSAHATPSEIARFKHEYEKIRKLDSQGIFKTYDIFNHKHFIAIVAEPFYGHPLYKRFAPGELDIETFLKLGINLSRTLSEIHNQGIVHHSITPDTILCNESGTHLKLNGFGAYGLLSRVKEEIYDPWVIRHVLPYMAPEQTGRMNYPVDYRVDLYALGVILYELLTGKAPFVSDDPIEIIHSHIARQPTAPVEKKPDVPPVLSEIVMKLLSKTVENRYQSGYGLMADLAGCARQLQRNGEIRHMPLARHDRAIGFRLTERLFGRETEIESLMAAFDRTANGGKELFIIAGEAGIGKSSLVNEIQKPIVARRAYFIAGKAEQYKRDIPYHPIIQAFKEFARQVLCESDERISAWKDQILGTVGTNASLITQFIPEFEPVIGKQPALTRLAPEEARIRFNFVFNKFVKSCASATSPLVIFIDDLQWTDTATLNLLQMLSTAPEISHLLLIGAYRDNAVEVSHPLLRSLSEAQKNGALVNRIKLPSLSADSVNQMIVDLLRCNMTAAWELSLIVHKKTNGNPFFIHQFLKTLYDAKALALDPESGFKWDIDKVAEIQVTDNVVDFMAAKISRMPDAIRDTLRICACYGNRFNLLAVAACHGKSLEETVANLSAAEAEGLIGFKGDTGFFSHDRIREAVYRLLSAEERKQTHYLIGRYLLENTPDAKLRDSVVDIVNHLNIAQVLISSPEERYRLAGLNARAGRKAMTSGAFEAALHYYQTGISLLSTISGDGKAAENMWDAHYSLALSLYNGASEAAYLTADYGKMHRLTAQVIDNARSLNDQAKVQIVRLHTLMAKNQLDEVIQSGLSILKSMGISFPKNPTKLHILRELAKTRIAIKGKKPKDFLSLPLMKDPTVQAQVDIMATITSTAYWTAPNLLPIIVFRLMQIFSKYGNTGFSPYIYAGYGFILCTLFDMDNGYAFGQMALSLLNRMNIPQYRARTEMVANTFIRHWKEHAVNAAEPLLQAYKNGLDNGDIEFAGHSLMVRGYTQFLLAAPLEELDIEFEKNEESLSRLGQVTNLNVACMYHQATLNLRGLSSNPGELIGKVYNEKKMQPVHEKASDRTALMHLHFNKLLLNVVMENPETAYPQALKIMTFIDGGIGSLIYPCAFFYDSLARLGYCEQADRLTKARILLKVARNQHKLKKWADHAPANFLHKYHLVEAELSRLKGRDKDAIDNYKTAIISARQNEYEQEAALACEFLAKFYFSQGIHDFAASYMTKAHKYYMNWGALAKTRQLEANYRTLLETGGWEKTDSPSLEASEALTPARIEGRLDIKAMMKMSQAISSEIQMEKLLKTLMQVIIENSGAEKALLILNRNEGLVIEAETDINAEEISILQSIPVDESANLAAGIVSYAKRTREPLVLDDAFKASRFAGDPYISKNAVRSVLCMPLLRQQRLIGLIYMENNLTPNAFTPARLEMIMLLATQAANCLENAIFFEGTLAAEKRAQKQREEYQRLIETMNDGLVITDPDLNIIYVNQALCRMSGYEAEEIVSHAAFDFLNEENQNKIAEEAGNWPEWKRHVFEIEGIAKDGKAISAIISPKPLHNEEGQFTGFLAIVTDVTNLKKAQREKELAQAQLIQSQKMEAIGTLAGGVAHDFNNYLMTILGSIDLIELKGSLPENLAKHVSDIKNAAELSAALTRQLLAFSRRQMLETANVDLNAVITDIQKMLKRLIGEYIQLKTNLAPDLKSVNADFGQMEQIIMNLAINARDAMPNGGSLYVETANVSINESYCQQVRYAKPGEFVRLTVEDNGEGMDPEIVKKIFDPFFSTKAVGQGTGLGLSVVYGVVKQHKGWINVYSEPNRGTIFKIYMPAASWAPGEETKDAAKDPSAAADLYRGNQERILLIEDQADVRNVVASALKMNDYWVKETESISQALKYLEQEDVKFDLVFSDVVLPDGNGIDFAEYVSRKYPHIKILLSSGYTEEHSRPDKIAKKEFHFLQKPYQIIAMLEIVKQILS